MTDATEAEVLAELRATPDGLNTWRLLREDHRALLADNHALKREQMRALDLAYKLISAPDWGRQDAGQRLFAVWGRCGACGARSVMRHRGVVIHNGCPGPPAVRRRKPIGLWTIRTSSSGVFAAAKASGDIFRGSRRED